MKALANIPWLDRVGKKVCGMETIEATDRNKKETGHCKLDAEQTTYLQMLEGLSHERLVLREAERTELATSEKS